ncbi:putative membrane protein [Propionispora sp. 2/2-37]|uniref:preprotein translocase subunit SecG n=1 Tax=Propionispora sp. 2/2-37 TaxID=1677858 RepID=UPI0006BB8B34|nr:preprotein translocase subunit SecG [Propionispora sp. 2/2-37]CUH94343.1 putative membrane protein [Propionispora sp. 2/2-37]
MITALQVVDAIVSIALILSVILQSGKGGGLSGSIAGGAETMFGGKKRGLDEQFARATMILGILFGMINLVLIRLS